MTPIEKARNLGPVIGAELRLAGVPTLEALQEMGWPEAWQRLRELRPSRDHLICGMALAGADLGYDWNRLPPPIRAEVEARQWNPPKSRKLAKNRGGDRFLGFPVK